MKKITLIITSIVLIFQLAFSQQIVNDKYKRRQMESMVATRWGKFIPKWYYILFHNKYRKGDDRRTMLQLLPTMAATTITKEQSKQEQEDTDQVFQQYVWINTNRTLEPVYQLQFKPVFQKLSLEIDALLIQAQQLQVAPSVIQTFQFEQARLNEQIDILRNGFLAQQESTEGYHEIEKELEKLKTMIHKYIRHQRILNKYSQL